MKKTNQEQERQEFKRIITTVASVVGLMGVLIAFNHCGLEPNHLNTRVAKKTTSTATSDSTSPLPNGSNTPDPNDLGNTLPQPADNPIVTQTVELGIKDFAMVMENMSAVTGVPATQSNIQNVYNDLVTQLPSDNNVKSFLPANQVAITKLAAEFCDALVETAALRASLWPGINFGAGPATALVVANRRLIIQNAINRFWGDGILNAMEMTGFETHLMQLFNELLANESTTNAVVTRTAVKGVCLAVLASSPTELL